MKKKIHYTLLLSVFLVLFTISCNTPTTPTSKESPSQITSQPQTKEQLPPKNSAESKPVPEPVSYTLKYYTKSDDSKFADYFWANKINGTFLINFKSPTTPFTIQQIKFLATIIGNDKQNWANMSFKLKIWDKLGNKELWSGTFPYTDFDLNMSKWGEYKVPDIKVDDTFSIEYDSKSDVTTVGYGPTEKLVYKCGLAMGVDYAAQNANTDMTFKGQILPWDDTFFQKHSKENMGWMLRVEGKGLPQK